MDFNDVNQAAEMVDRFNRLFPRTVRRLRDLRRYILPVTTNKSAASDHCGCRAASECAEEAKEKENKSAEYRYAFFGVRRGLVGSGNEEAVLIVLHEGGVAYVSVSLLMLLFQRRRVLKLITASSYTEGACNEYRQLLEWLATPRSRG